MLLLLVRLFGTWLPQDQLLGIAIFTSILSVTLLFATMTLHEQ